MDPETFFSAALPWARVASRLTAVNVSVVLAQWADETGYGGPDWSPRNNPGNVGDTEAGGQVVYPTLAAGVEAYVRTMLLPYYVDVRGWGPTPAEADASAVNLGKSPWAAGHYNNGGGPGSALLAIMGGYDLYQYDVPATPAEPREGDEMDAVVLSDGTVVSHVNVGGHYVEVTRKPGTAGKEAAGNVSVIDLTLAFPGQLTGVTN